VFWWQVVKLVRAIRNGWIKFDKPKEEPKYYLLWGDETDTADNTRQGLSYIPAPKPNLPGSLLLIFFPEAFFGHNN
jgi:ribosome biogenesis protein ERB1